MNNTEIATLVDNIDDGTANRLFSALYSKLSGSLFSEEQIQDSLSSMVNENVTEERIEEIAQEIISGDEIHVQAGEFLVSVIDTAIEEQGYFFFDGLCDLQDDILKRAIDPSERDD